MFSKKIVDDLILYRGKFLVEMSRRTNFEKILREQEKTELYKKKTGFDRNFQWTDSDPIRLNQTQTNQFKGRKRRPREARLVLSIVCL